MRRLLLLFVCCSASLIQAQKFTRKDSLQGGLRPERTCFDVIRYDLTVRIDPATRTIRGNNKITFEVLSGTKDIQLDLFENMQVDSILWDSRKLEYRREFGAVFVSFPMDLKAGSKQTLRFYYSGTPVVAPHAPWQGGFVWSKDKQGKDFIGVAVQGTGASLWYPVKDTQTDEPDQGAGISLIVPNGLTAVSNGRFKGSAPGDSGYTSWSWEVKSPINNYDITANIGDYAHIHDTHKGLDLDYYVLRANEGKAREHFQEVHAMLDCFQDKFGPYPFAEDGFKLVETPYLGMEHQSAVAYGNDYLKGYKGRDLSGTGIGLAFDYITVHESGHEWFGNSITSADIADMWIHEGFTMYSEAVFIECIQNKEKAYAYMDGISKNIHNYDPVIGQFGVNNEGSGDMYPKGAWLLHTLRNVLNDDSRWWEIMRKYCKTYRHKIIDTKTVCAFFSKEMGLDLQAVFEQYLQTTLLPELVLTKEADGWSYVFQNTVPGFSLPVDVVIDGKTHRIVPDKNPKRLKSTGKTIALKPNRYLITEKIR